METQEKEDYFAKFREGEKFFVDIARAINIFAKKWFGAHIVGEKYLFWDSWGETENEITIYEQTALKNKKEILKAIKKRDWKKLASFSD